MHDIIVETVYPDKRNQPSTSKEISPTVKEAVKKAALRIKNFKNRRHSKSICSIRKLHSKLNSVGGEINDFSYHKNNYNAS